MKVSYFVCFICMSYVIIGSGFLLEPSTPAQTHGQATHDNSNGALFELLLDEKKHRLELEKRLEALEKQTGYNEHETKLEQLSKYILSVEKKLDNFISETLPKLPENETVDSVSRAEVRNTSAFMETKLKSLENKYDDLTRSYGQTVTNVSVLQTKLSHLEHLKSLNQTQVLDTLQKNVRTLDIKVDRIISNANARNQDFLALYNKTIVSEMTWNKTARQLSQKIDNISTKGDQDYWALYNKTTVSEISWNQTASQLLSKIDMIARKVALTACLTSTTQVKAGNLLQFGTILSKVGVDLPGQFANNDVFTCLNQGTYLVTATIVTHYSDNTYISIVKNDKEVFSLYDYNGNNGAHSSSGAVILELTKNDKIYFKSKVEAYLYGNNLSCFSIVKI